MSENYDLTTSSKALGKLYPILKDKHGNIIDGFHRQNADPDWPAITVDLVDNPQKLELARLAVNFCRRQLPATEIEQRVAFLVKSGMKPQEIADNTGISLSTVYKYMPHEAKDVKKAEAGVASGVARVSVPSSEHTVKTPDTALEQVSFHKAESVALSSKVEMRECERCHVSTTVPKPWHGHTLCSKCYERAEGNPVAYDGWFKMLERGKATTATQPKVAKPSIESWEQRKAAMSPQKSRMELELLEAFSNDDSLRPVVTDRKYPIVEVEPDFVFPRHNLAVFTDGAEVHAGREDRDERNRQALASKHGLKVLSITYSGNSDAEKQRIIAEVKGAI